MGSSEQSGNTLTNVGRQRSVRERRDRLGMSAKALAEVAGVDRSRVQAIEEGRNVRSSTLGAVEAALDRLEQEMSGPYDARDEPRSVTVRLRSVAGVDVTVEGPVDDLAELETSALRLLARLEGQPNGT